MTDDLQADEDGPNLATPEPIAEIVTDVEFIIPAPTCETITTDELELTSPFMGDRSEARSTTTAEIQELGEVIERRFDALQRLFEREIRAEATREKVVDRLHAELQEYKQDLLLNILRPVFVDLIQLHDDIGKMAAALSEAEARRLLDIAQGIEDILYRQGVEPYAHEGDAFDPRRQRAVATVPTDDPTLNKTIAVRNRKGFQAGEKVIRPEVVSVYALRK